MSTTDRELLEMAAKAINCDIKHMPSDWNPIINDGDSLRLAVGLSIGVFRDGLGVYCNHSGARQVRIYATEISDPCAATRRAIVRAAAEIGKVK